MSERAGDGFYVDRAGHVRACRTGERMAHPSATEIEEWAITVEKALEAITPCLGEYEGTDLAGQLLLDLQRRLNHWRQNPVDSAPSA